MKCIICGEEFKDGWDHVLVSTKGVVGLFPKNKAHAEYLEKLDDSRWGLSCFCGGHISTYGHGSPDGDASWETTCDDCGFLYDED